MNIPVHLDVRNLDLAYGSFVLMQDLNFQVLRGEVFVIMGGSGCGKSTLLRQLLGLKESTRGAILYQDRDLASASPGDRKILSRRFGVSFQTGALWSSLTLAENVALPLEEFTRLSRHEIDALV